MRQTPMRYTPVRCTPCEVYARKMHARKMHARKMHARKVHAHKVHAHKIHAHQMHTYAHETPMRRMVKILAGCPTPQPNATPELCIPRISCRIVSPDTSRARTLFWSSVVSRWLPGSTPLKGVRCWLCLGKMWSSYGGPLLLTRLRHTGLRT